MAKPPTRRRQAVALAVEGRTVAEIAAEMGIGPKMVTAHLRIAGVKAKSPARSRPLAEAAWHPMLPGAAECQRLLSELQPRQQEIVALLARGWAPAEIARAFGISAKTVGNQLEQAAMKLDVRPAKMLAAFYWRAAEAEAPEVEPAPVFVVAEPAPEHRPPWRPRSSLDMSAAELRRVV